MRLGFRVQGSKEKGFGVSICELQAGESWMAFNRKALNMVNYGGGEQKPALGSAEKSKASVL